MIVAVCGRIGVSGRLGLGVEHSVEKAGGSDRSRPVQIPRLKGHSIASVSAGYSHTAALTTSGQLYVWGAAACGKLGLGRVDAKFELFCHAPTLVRLPATLKVCAP